MADQWTLLEYIKQRSPEWVSRQELLEKFGPDNKLSYKALKLFEASFVHKEGLPFKLRYRAKRKSLKEKRKEWKLKKKRRESILALKESVLQYRKYTGY